MSEARVTAMQALKNRTTLIIVVATLAVVLIWAVAFFNPEGHKLGSVHSQIQQAQNAQVQLEEQLARLKAYSHDSAAFESLQQRLNAALPATTDIYDYVTQISNAAAATGVKVESLSPGTPTASGSVTTIPVTLSAKATYDQTLSFIKAVYALPRLTTITSMGLTGGGTGTSRSTVLQETFSLQIVARSPVGATGSG